MSRKNKILEEYLFYLNEFDPITAVSAFSTALGALSAAQNYYKNNLTKYAKSCSNLEGDSKRLCVLKIKIKENQELLNEFKKIASLCSREKNPKKKEKCVEKTNKKIEKVKITLDNLNFELKTLIETISRKKRAAALK